ncbi:MAG: 16S rRNA (uracil(1498)-N(3))-methyltransferase [Desulfotomaculales bacterium]
MRVPRFFVPPDAWAGDRVTITGRDYHHIRHVLRLGPGARLIVLDGGGRSFEAVIETVQKGSVSALVTGEAPALPEPPVKVTLVQGLPRGEKMELIVQKATEIGVTGIVPLAAARAVLRLAGDRAGRRRLRWQRIAVEAAEQSGRGRFPVVGEIQDLAGVLRGLPEGAAAFLLWEAEQATTLKQVLRAGPARAEVYLFIGPEGGFTRDEVAAARDAGVVPVSLGGRILRTETAGLVAAALVLYEWADLGG